MPPTQMEPLGLLLTDWRCASKNGVGFTLVPESAQCIKNRSLELTFPVFSRAKIVVARMR